MMPKLRVARALLGAVWGACACALIPVLAQDAPQGGQEPVATLRVFVDLVQIPVLVLNNRLEPMTGVDAGRFTVSVDSGPAVHPRHVRVEGDDPISLGVLLDVESRRDAMGKVAGGLAALVPGSLHATDHVTLFGLQCHLYRSLYNVTGQPALLLDGMERVLKAGASAGAGKASAHPCAGEVFLWDALYRMLEGLPKQAGRQVVMVLSDGQDRGSKRSWKEVLLLAQGMGVAIFGLSADKTDPMQWLDRPASPGRAQTENEFRLVCESSGGLVVRADAGDVQGQMARVMAMVRQRYVVEFSRPRENVPGRHELLVKVAKGHAFVRAAGASVSIPDPAVEKDPMTIPRDTKDALELGKRRILTGQPH